MTALRRVFLGALAAGLGLLVAAGADAQPAPAVSGKPATAAAKSAKKPKGPDVKLVLEPRAMELLKATSARLAAAKTLSFTAIASYEYPSQLGPAIVYTSRYDVTLQRPDKLRVLMPGDGPASEFYFDGKVMMAFALAEDLVAVADAPATIDAALKAAYQNAAIYFPFTDLMLTDPYAALTEGGILAFYIGPSGIVGGTKTEMVAWASNDVFLQIWIGAEDKLPRRVRAVYSADPLRLRHDVELSNWKLDAAIPPDTFASKKAQAAKRISFARPVAPPPPGVKPMGITPKTGAPVPKTPATAK